MPNIIGARMVLIFPNKRVIVTKPKRINSNCFGNLKFKDFFSICGAKVKISKNIFVEAMCHKWRLIEFMIDNRRINFTDTERYLFNVSDI